MSTISDQKRFGAYYTPDGVANSLVRWTVRRTSDRLLDPACGDGRFISLHRLSVGVEHDPDAAREAMQRAPWALVHEGDFFAWVAHTVERFDCVAGNPPFIRYQTFKGATRELAQRFCASLGVHFSGLSSSWAPFLVAAASVLKPGGRMAFVVPAEIGHAPYAAPLLEYLIGHFAKVQIVAVREKLFPDLSEDCWLLYAEGFGSDTRTIGLSVFDRFEPKARPPAIHIAIDVEQWRSLGMRRLRTYLLPPDALELYFDIASRSETRRLGDFARIGIGYVSGANEFFHLRPSEASRLAIPGDLLCPTVRNGRALPSERLTSGLVSSWLSQDDPILLLRLPKTGVLPSTVRRYLDTEAGHEARLAYKCRMREPWYSVPDVQVPDFFLSYMSGRSASLVRNDAHCTCTNSVHSVRLLDAKSAKHLQTAWQSPLARLSCELEGHPLGGGMLKLEPREAQRVIIPSDASLSPDHAAIVAGGLNRMKQWRHYGATA
jgi:hypothetical protein